MKCATTSGANQNQEGSNVADNVGQQDDDDHEQDDDDHNDNNHHDDDHEERQDGSGTESPVQHIPEMMLGEHQEDPDIQVINQVKDD